MFLETKERNQAAAEGGGPHAPVENDVVDARHHDLDERCVDRRRVVGICAAGMACPVSPCAGGARPRNGRDAQISFRLERLSETKRRLKYSCPSTRLSWLPVSHEGIRMRARA